MGHGPIIVWGAFGVDGLDAGADSVAQLEKFLSDNKLTQNLIFWVDNAERKWGKKLLGKPVYSPKKILEYPQATVIINSLSFWDIKNDIDEMGAKNEIKVVPYYWYSGTEYYPYSKEVAKDNWLKHGEEITSMFNMSDEETRTQMNMIAAMRTGGEDRLYSLNDYQGTGKKLNYFCDDELAPKSDVTFVDAGAFRGETIKPVAEFYGDKLKKVVAFEPDPENLNELKAYVMGNVALRDITDIYEYALDNETKKATFSINNIGSAIVENSSEGITVNCIPFDAMTDIKFIGDVMIKMDIEGSELAALQGMEKFIKLHEPYLAICLYHKTTDLYDVPHYVKTICPDYILYFRGGWHLEMWAIPKRHYSNFL